MDVYGFVAQQTDGVIIVGFRGTNPLDLKDWIDDIWYFPTSGPYGGCTGCEVHDGFYQSYLHLSSQMYEAVNKYGGANAPEIHVTGHSLGGAMSTLAVYEMILAGYPVTQHIDFGRPRVGNPAFASSFEDVVRYHNVSGVKINPAVPQSHWSPFLTEAVRKAALAAPKEVLHASTASAVRSAAQQLEHIKASAPNTVSPTKAGRRAASAHILRSVHETLLSNLDFSASLRSTLAGFNTTSWRVTHNADPVPHLPLEAMGFAHPAQEIWYNEDQSRYTTCSATDGEDPSCSDSVPLDIDVIDHLSYMQLDIALMCGIAKTA